MDIRENIDRIKQTIRWFPGLVLGLSRQVGKTSALLEIIHEDHAGHATVYSLNNGMSRHAEQMYKDKYPGDKVPNFVSRTERTHSRNDAIYADDWWDMSARDRRELLATTRLAARIGTEFGTRNLDSHVIRFTDEELNCLEAMLDVLVHGGGHYLMLNLPEVVEIHRDLWKKFRDTNQDVDRG